jgi:hypothetical protein
MVGTLALLVLPTLHVTFYFSHLIPMPQLVTPDYLTVIEVGIAE